MDGEASDFNGGRTAPEIVAWVRRKSADAVTPLASAADAEAFRARAGGEYLVLGMFADLEGADAAAFRAAAEALEESFAATSSADVAAHLGVPAATAAAAGTPRVAIVKSYDEKLSLFEGDAFTADAVAAFVRAYSRPLVMAFSPASSAAIFRSRFQVLVVTPAAEDGDDGGLAEALRAAAAAARGAGVQFVTVDPAEESNSQVLQFFGCDADTAVFPLVFGFDSGEPPEGAAAKFRAQPPPGGPGAVPSVESLTAFAAAVAARTAPAFRLSAPPPERNDGPVTVVTGDTFEALVLADDMDVLLEVYAPWCGHCKQLEPIYQKLGRRFADVPTVRIAKMDGTANEHPAAVASGYPTLLFFPARKDVAQGVPYEGDRTLKALTKWIKTQAALPYELPKKAAATQAGQGAGGGDAAAAAHDELR